MRANFFWKVGTEVRVVGDLKFGEWVGQVFMEGGQPLDGVGGWSPHSPHSGKPCLNL